MVWLSTTQDGNDGAYDHVYDFFTQAAECGAADLFLPTRFRALAKDRCARANEEALASLPTKIRASILKGELLLILSYCVIDPVSIILAFSRAGETN